MKTLKHLRWTYLAALLIFMGCTLALGAYTLQLAHREALSRGLYDVAAQAGHAENALTQNLSTLELSIGNTMTDIERNPSADRWQDTLTRALRDTPVLRSLSVLNADGQILASTNPANIGVTVLSETYLPLTQAPTERLRIGAAWTGRDFDQEQPANGGGTGTKALGGFIPVLSIPSQGARKLSLLAAIDIDYVIKNLIRPHQTAGSELSVLLSNGTLLFSSHAGAPLGRQAADLPTGLNLAERQSDMLERQLKDGTSVLVAFQTSAQFPFVVVTQSDQSVALKTWQRNSLRLGAMVGAAILLVIAIGFTLYRRQRELMLGRAESLSRQALNAKVFDASMEGIFICDANNNIVSVNPAFERITGYPASEVQGRNPRILASDLDDHFFHTPLWHQQLKDDLWQGELMNQHADGSSYCAQVTITLNRNKQGRVQHYIGNLVDVTAEKKMAEALRQSEHQYRSLFENIQHGFALHEIVTDDSGKPCNYRLLAANPTYMQILGLAPGTTMGQLVTDLFPFVLQDKLDWIGIYGDVALSGTPRRFESFSEGLDKWFDVVAYQPMPRQFAVLASDITERKNNEEKLHLAASVFANSREGIMITAPDGTIIDVNDAFTNITGYSRDESVGQTPRILNSGRQSSAFYQSLWNDLHSKGHWYGEIWNRNKSGDVYAEMQTITSVLDADGQTQHFVSLFSDVTAAKEHEKKLQHIAHYDALTNLPNRVLLGDRLHQGMAQTLRHGNMLAVAFLDLDAFKSINDTHGHEVGDALLIALSGRMRNALREADTLARIGGDEFVVVLSDLTDAAASLPMLNRLLSAAAQPVQIGDVELQLSASLGVTFYPQPEDVEADQLLRQADQAMYQAKIAGKNRYHIFDADLDRSVRGQHESIERIRLALANREFVLYYQPKVNMRSGQLIGAEALIRWQHPEKGLLSPAVFLPVIENHPLAIEVGEWVIEAGLAQMRQWRVDGLKLPVSVNIGARQLQHANFTERLVALLAAYPDINSGELELEVLETSALEDIAGVSRVIQACREIGVKFALDDFGTGYSSLTYLKRLPVTMLKIDQSFVRDMLDDPDDLAILQGVIGLASAFRRDVIAEGVETVAHGSLLLQLGCELAQGYGIARPMPAQDMPAWAAAWRPDAAWQNQTVISKEALPLLLAGADLRAWVATVLKFLKGDRADLHSMGDHDCHIGQWIDVEGLHRYRDNAAYTAVATAHDAIHELAAALIELHRSQQPTQHRWPELITLRNTLLEQLDVLIKESR